MPEGAPGNPGAERDRPAQQARMRKVREMQAKLHRWAGEDSSRRFGDLFNLVCDPEFLAEAWFRVAGNTGKRTPGIDAVTVADIENGIGVGVFLEEIRGLLKSGEFRPVAVRQVITADILVHHDTPSAARGMRTHLVHDTCSRQRRQQATPVLQLGT